MVQWWSSSGGAVGQWCSGAGGPRTLFLARFLGTLVVPVEVR